MIQWRLALAVLVMAATTTATSAAEAPIPGVVPSYCLPTGFGYRCLVGPFDIAAGEMHEVITGVAAPSESGYITWGKAELVDGQGRAISHHAVHLHHAVWLNPYERDMTCDSYDGGTFPGYERFFASGKESTKLDLPRGYGYLWDPQVSQPYTGSAPWWAFTAHLDGMHGASDVYVQFDVGYVPESDAADLTNVQPVWLDVRNCSSDPVYDVNKRGRSELHKERWTYKMTTSGRFVFLAGHLHDGGLRLSLENLSTNEHVYTSRATYALEAQPWYLTKMSSWSDGRGIDVDKGDKLRLTSVYDSTRSWNDVMAIMIGALVADA